MNPKFYKKTGLTTIKIARDFYTMQVGDRVPTIADYTELLGVSRGIVQKALGALAEAQCIETSKNGVKGSFAVKIDYEKLYHYTEWGSLTGTMPVPLTLSLSSLTTAICEEMENSPFPFSFAYVTGSEKRLTALAEMIYDFIVVTRSTAQRYLEKYDFLEEAVELTNCIYSQPYVIYFFDETKREIEDGMRVAVDKYSTDQYNLSQMLCEGKSVDFVQVPYVSFSELLSTKTVDCFIYRQDGWYNNEAPDLAAYPLDFLECSAWDTVTPVILTNKDNYGFKKLLRQCISAKKAYEIQEKVIRGEKAVKFY